MQVRFKSVFSKDLIGKDASLLRRVKQLIEQLENTASLSKIPHVKKLKGFHQYYRIRVGEYRMGVKWEGNVVVCERFLHRKEIYRYFP